VAVVMISIDEEDLLVPLYLKKKPAAAVMLLSRDQRKPISDAYGVNGIPANFIIDKAGIVRNYGAGFGQGTEKKLRDWIETALGISPPAASSR
jgi:hypothetical protein